MRCAAPQHLTLPVQLVSRRGLGTSPRLRKPVGTHVLLRLSSSPGSSSSSLGAGGWGSSLLPSEPWSSVVCQQKTRVTRVGGWRGLLCPPARGSAFPVGRFLGPRAGGLGVCKRGGGEGGGWTPPDPGVGGTMQSPRPGPPHRAGERGPHGSGGRVRHGEREAPRGGGRPSPQLIRPPWSRFPGRMLPRLIRPRVGRAGRGPAHPGLAACRTPPSHAPAGLQRP